MALSGDQASWIFAFVLLVPCAGGAAAFASGRAVARAWRSFASLWPGLLALTGAVGFLHYALFGLSAIPAATIGEALTGFQHAPSQGLRALGASFSYSGAVLIVLTGFAYLGFRLARAAQMAGQYSFLFQRVGPFNWRRLPEA